MNGKQLATIVLATIVLTYCIQETEASFKLKKLLKAGLIIKALSPNKIILPIPIPIPIKINQQHHHHGHGGHDFHGGYHGGHGFDYGHGGYHGGHGYDYGHGGYHSHSSGYHLSHGW